MSTELHDRLASLAAATQASSPPADLWTRGVRRRHLISAGRTAVAVALVVLVALGGWTWHVARPVQPAHPGGGPHLPDRFFYNVSPWTKPFDGPPGPLVTVYPNLRKTLWHTTNGLIGVSATSGRYGFVDLPGDAVVSDAPTMPFALSPDGRLLAFWVDGVPSGRPNTVREGGQTVTGIGVYDASTGRVRESRFATVHGIEPRYLLWSDDSELVVSYGQIQGADGTQDETSSGFGATVSWDMSSPRPTTLPPGRLWSGLDGYSARATRGRLVAPGVNPRTWRVGDPTDPGASIEVFRTDLRPDLLVLSPDQRRAIGVLDHNRRSGPLAVVDLTGAGDGRVLPMRTLPWGRQWLRPMAWVDRDHVAVLRRVVIDHADLGQQVTGRLELVDIRTGVVRTLVDEFGGNASNMSDGWIARGLLTAPRASATPPPSPPDLRSRTLWLGLLAAFVLVCGVALGSSRARRT